MSVPRKLKSALVIANKAALVFPNRHRRNGLSWSRNQTPKKEARQVMILNMEAEFNKKELSFLSEKKQSLNNSHYLDTPRMIRDVSKNIEDKENKPCFNVSCTIF